MERTKKNEIDFSSLSDQVYRHIKGMILTGELKGGEKIPEEKIATSFGVSRTPIREALRKLEKHGLIEIIPRRHAQVIKLEPIDKRHVGQVRLQLDTLSVRLLAERAAEEDFHELKEIAEQCSEFAHSADFAACFEKDSELHCELARRSGNPYLYEMVRNLDIKVQLLRNIEDISEKKTLEGISLHLPIIQAVFDHDAEEAERLITKHLTDYYFPGT